MPVHAVGQDKRRDPGRVLHPEGPPPPRTREEGWARLLEVERAEDALCGPLGLGNAGAEALFLPVGRRLTPPLRRDRLRELFETDGMRAVVVVDGPGGDASRTTPALQALASRSFRPASVPLRAKPSMKASR